MRFRGVKFDNRKLFIQIFGCLGLMLLVQINWLAIGPPRPNPCSEFRCESSSNILPYLSFFIVVVLTVAAVAMALRARNVPSVGGESSAILVTASFSFFAIVLVGLVLVSGTVNIFLETFLVSFAVFWCSLIAVSLIVFKKWFWIHLTSRDVQRMFLRTGGPYSESNTDAWTTKNTQTTAQVAMTMNYTSNNPYAQYTQDSVSASSKSAATMPTGEAPMVKPPLFTKTVDHMHLYLNKAPERRAASRPLDGSTIQAEPSSVTGLSEYTVFDPSQPAESRPEGGTCNANAQEFDDNASQATIDQSPCSPVSPPDSLSQDRTSRFFSYSDGSVVSGRTEVPKQQQQQQQQTTSREGSDATEEPKVHAVVEADEAAVATEAVEAASVTATTEATDPTQASETRDATQLRERGFKIGEVQDDNGEPWEEFIDRNTGDSYFLSTDGRVVDELPTGGGGGGDAAVQISLT